MIVLKRWGCWEGAHNKMYVTNKTNFYCDFTPKKIECFFFSFSLLVCCSAFFQQNNNKRHTLKSSFAFGFWSLFVQSLFVTVQVVTWKNARQHESQITTKTTTQSFKRNFLSCHTKQLYYLFVCIHLSCLSLRISILI